MANNQYFEIITTDGKTLKYQIITAFKLASTGKYYIVFTDNLEQKTINIYAANYDPDDDTKFESIQTEAEWQIIKDQVNKIFQKTHINLKKENF